MKTSKRKTDRKRIGRKRNRTRSSNKSKRSKIAEISWTGGWIGKKSIWGRSWYSRIVWLICQDLCW